MKLYEFGLVIVLIVLALTICGSLAHKFSDEEHHTGIEEYRGHDDVPEEFCQDVIEVLTGEQKDLTPESPEK